MAKPRYKNDRKNNRRLSVKSGRSDTKDPSAKFPAKKSVESTSEREVLPIRPFRAAERLSEQTGMVLQAPASDFYALMDSGDGEKLERYGALTIRRPEGQAIWRPTLPEHEWSKADAVFTGNTEEEGPGRWRFKNIEQEETWSLSHNGLAFLGRFTSFRHTGVFPEQIVHWNDMKKAIESVDRPVTVLNLFGYTGLASLIAAQAGAKVTHVDASKKAIGWARENQILAGLDDAPIRWICDDAMKFCQREVRRGQSYDIILLDPPAYGRGPKGEIWQLFTHLPHMLDLVRELQSPTPLLTTLTSYAIRASSFALHEIMQEVFAGMVGRIESGELILAQEMGGRKLSTSMFSRIVAKGCEL